MMTWWQAGIVGWIAASLALAMVVARAAAPRVRLNGPSLAGRPPAPEVVSSMLDVLSTIIREAERRPDAVSRISGLEQLLSDGYAVALALEAEWRRLGREIDELLDRGGFGAETEISARTRRRREVERIGHQLRERLDVVWYLTQEHASTARSGNSG